MMIYIPDNDRSRDPTQSKNKHYLSTHPPIHPSPDVQFVSENGVPHSIRTPFHPWLRTASPFDSARSWRSEAPAQRTCGRRKSHGGRRFDQQKEWFYQCKNASLAKHGAFDSISPTFTSNSFGFTNRNAGLNWTQFISRNLCLTERKRGKHERFAKKKPI